MARDKALDRILKEMSTEEDAVVQEPETAFPLLPNDVAFELVRRMGPVELARLASVSRGMRRLACNG
jgi:hypothetical protein